MLGNWARQRREKERHWQDGLLSQKKEENIFEGVVIFK